LDILVAQPDYALISISEPEFAFPNTATIELYEPEDEEKLFSCCPLLVDLFIGDEPIYPGGEKRAGFTLRFKRVFLALALRECTVDRKQRYEYVLPTEDFNQVLQRVVENSKSGEVGAKAQTNTILKSLLSAFGLDAEAKVNVEASIKSGKIDTLDSKLKFKLVRCISNRRWEIGHEFLGDPTEMDSLLRERYLHKSNYGEPEDKRPPLCLMKPKGRKPYIIDVELRARKSDCVYVPISSRSVRGQSHSKKEKIEELYVLKVLETQNRRDGFVLPRGEVVLARSVLKVRRKRTSRKKSVASDSEQVTPPPAG